MYSPEEEIESLLLSFSKTVSSQMIRSTLDMISATISKKTIEESFEIFARTHVENDKPTLEVALLTRNNVIHDFTNTFDEYQTTYWKLSSATQVILKTYNMSETQEVRAGKPYRAELEISDGVKFLTYAAEGDRRVVNSLIKFGQACLRAISKLP